MRIRGLPVLLLPDHELCSKPLSDPRIPVGKPPKPTSDAEPKPVSWTRRKSFFQMMGWRLVGLIGPMCFILLHVLG